MTDPRSFNRVERLRDGTPVTVRAVRPDDKDRIVAAFRALEPASIYARFFQHKTALSEQELRGATELDFENDVALVVTLGQGDQEIIIGGARYSLYQDRNGQRNAEIAFTVEEDYHGQGIASLLLQLLIPIARERGICRFTADVLAENAAMLAVFSRCGLPMATESHPDGIQVSLALRD